MGGGCRDIVTGKSHAGPHWQHQLLMTNKGGGYDDSSQGGGCAENCIHAKNNLTPVLDEIDRKNFNVACTYVREAQVLTNYRFGEVIDVKLYKGEVTETNTTFEKVTVEEKNGNREIRKLQVPLVTLRHALLSSFSFVVTLSKPPFVTLLLFLNNDPRKTQRLLALEGAEDRLKLFKANLLEEGSYDSTVEGCEGVFHTASPFNHDVKDPEAELLDPAVKGTLNVLNSCANSSSIKRVVLTSIIAAVTYNRKRQTPDAVDESWFTDIDYCRGLKISSMRYLNLTAKCCSTCQSNPLTYPSCI
ncbi:hypothetical protein Gotur_008702 [Gossypium turneri]